MGRPREFDETEALEAAMGCFWRDGYEATSVRDLAACMGITSASLYNTFSDKRALFRQALHRYIERSTHERIHRLESTLPPKEAARAFVNEIVERSLDDQDRRGCLLVNSALEIALHDAERGAELVARLSDIEMFFRRVIAAAQANGSVPPSRNFADLARGCCSASSSAFASWLARTRNANSWRAWRSLHSPCSTGRDGAAAQQ